MQENIVGQIVENVNRYEVEWASFFNRARRNFDAVGLEQMATEDKAKLERLGRFPYEWNQLISQWKALTGAEITNRTTLKATPYGKKDATLAGIHTTVLNFYCNKARWNQARSDAFSSAIIGMLGWRYLSFIPTYDFPEGRPDVEAVSMFDVLPDPDCTVQDWDKGGNAIIYRRKLTAQGVLDLCVDEESQKIVEENIKISRYDKRDDGKPQLWAKFLRWMG